MELDADRETGEVSSPAHWIPMLVSDPKAKLLMRPRAIIKAAALDLWANAPLGLHKTASSRTLEAQYILPLTY